MSKLFAAMLATSAAVLAPLLTAQAQDNRHGTIGMSVPVLENPFWRAYADYGTATAKDLGASMLVVDANQSDAKQLADVEGLIARGVGCLIVTPNSSGISKGLLAKAEAAQVPLVFAERYPGFDPSNYSGKEYAGYLGVDNVAAGYSIAKALYDAGVRTIVAIGGVPGGAVADERSAGLHKFLAEHSDFKLLQELRNGELRQNGYTDAQNFLSAFPGPGFQGLWTYNDDTAMGAIKALKDAKVLDKIKIAAMDLIPEMVEAIKSGEALYSIGGEWVDAGEAAVMCYDAMNGKKNNPAKLDVTIPGVTKQNVEAYSKQFVDSTPVYDWKALSQVYNPNAKTTDFSVSIK
jgi:ABC-type sugar transport system substrate-binding protein